MKPKILLACNGNFLAHVSRILLIGRELQRRGCQVVYAASGQYAIEYPLIAGAPVVPLWTEPKADTMAFARGEQENLQRYCTNVTASKYNDLALLRHLAPDLVIGDFRWTMKLACEQLAMPYVSITNAAWTRYYAAKMDGWTMEAAAAKREEIGAYWGVPYGNNLFDVIEGDLTLIADLPTFAPMVGQPENVQYIGPMLWDGDCGWPAWRLMVDGKKPRIYVTMGSSGDDVTFGRVLTALADQDKWNVMITGTFDDVARTPNVPHFYYADRLPGLRACRDAHVVICHGGNGTIYQAIRGGCPIIGIPNTVEQRVHMQRVRDLKLGGMFDETFSEEALITAIETVMEPNPYSEHLWEVGAAMEAHPQAAEMKAADAILKLVG